MWGLWANTQVDSLFRCVEFARGIGAFNALEEADKLNLLRSGALEMILVRMSREINLGNMTALWNKKFAPAAMFNALGKNTNHKAIDPETNSHQVSLGFKGIPSSAGDGDSSLGSIIQY